MDFNIFAENGKKYIFDKNIYFKDELKIPTKENLDFFENPIETIKYFNKISEISQCINFEGTILLDLREVGFISIDCIMYMISFTRKLYIDSNKTVKFGFIAPKKGSSRKLVYKCGLKQFISGDKENYIEDCDDYFRIVAGTGRNLNILRDINEFSIDKLNKSKAQCYFINNMFVEMMDNTESHAYDINEDNKIWFIFVENTPTKLKYTFLDNGKGIPNTIYINRSFETNLVEMVDKALEKESKFIHSCMLGDILRTSTQKAYRGRGLPEIFSYLVKHRYIINLKIISGKGLCIYKSFLKNSWKFLDLSDNFEGTMFYWEVRK